MKSVGPSFDNVHPSRHQNVQFSTPRNTKRARANPSDQALQQTYNLSVNKIKGKIRDLTRLLERSERLPADVRIEKERALAGYRLDLNKAREEKRKKDIIRRYHMVRFFERQKATRVLKKMKAHASTLSPSSPDCDLSLKAVHEAEVDLNYTMYYPLTQKYQSLYPRVDGQASEGATDHKAIRSREQGKASRQDNPMWGLVEQSMSDGTLEELRDGKLGQSFIIEAPRSNTACDNARTAKYKKQRISSSPGGGVNGRGEVKPKEAAISDGEISDGGFFEE